MRMIILNWSEGENDPFTYFSRLWQRRLHEAGHTALIVPVDAATMQTVNLLHQQARVDLAFCWQGVGSTFVPAGYTQTVWEILRIPLVCLHADHPSYNPANHQQSSPYLLHIYGEAAFADAANRTIARTWPALHGIYPRLFGLDEVHAEFAGEFFVFPKNVQELPEIREEWRTRYDAQMLGMLSAAADAIERTYREGNVVNHHQVIFEHAPPLIREQVLSGNPVPLATQFMHDFSRELDRVHRNVAATFVVNALEQVPLRVYGRGWDRFKARGNPRHEFLPADRVEHSEHHYQSQFGILDVASSNDMLHDRTWRALQHGAGFLLSSAWQKGAPIRNGFDDLFFGGDPDELTRKAAIVQADPEAHRERCAAFGARLVASTPPTSWFLEQFEQHLLTRSLR
jgi:hypothetical protein